MSLERYLSYIIVRRRTDILIERPLSVCVDEGIVVCGATCFVGSTLGTGVICLSGAGVGSVADEGFNSGSLLTGWSAKLGRVSSTSFSAGSSAWEASLVCLRCLLLRRKTRPSSVLTWCLPLPWRIACACPQTWRVALELYRQDRVLVVPLHFDYSTWFAWTFAVVVSYAHPLVPWALGGGWMYATRSWSSYQKSSGLGKCPASRSVYFSNQGGQGRGHFWTHWLSALDSWLF